MGTKKIIANILLLTTLFSLFFIWNADYVKPKPPSQLGANIITISDGLLDKIYWKRNNYPTENLYIQYLDKLNTSLLVLKNKYSTTDSRNIVIWYLMSWINNIKSDIWDNTLQEIINIFNDDYINVSTNNTQTPINNTSTPPKQESNISVDTTQINITQPPVSNVSTPPKQETNTKTIMLSWIPHKVEWYDLSKSEFEYDYNNSTLKSKSLWITYDLGNPTLDRWQIYTSVAEVEDFCRAKGKNFRLPKTHEVKKLFDVIGEISSIESIWKEHSYTITRDAPNIPPIHIPNFIPLDILPNLVSNDRALWYYRINLNQYWSSWIDTKYNTFLSSLKSKMMAKSDDNSYYLQKYLPAAVYYRPDIIQTPNLVNVSELTVVCVSE